MPLVATPKKMFDPLKICDLKPLSIKDFPETIKKFPSKYITYCGTQAKGGVFQRIYLNKNCSI